MKKKRNFLLPLLMAIVMMAMSPQKVWAQDVYISHIKMGANKDNSKAKGYFGGWTHLDYDLNLGNGGAFVYLGYRTTTDVSQAIREIIMVDAGSQYQSYLGGHREDENGTNSYITIDGKKFYRAFAEGSANLNDQGNQTLCLVLYYTRDGNHAPINMLNITDKWGSAGYDYVPRYYLSDGEWKKDTSDSGTSTSYPNTGATCRHIVTHSHSYGSNGVCSSLWDTNCECHGKPCTAGTGTSSSPYQIANAGNLLWFAEKVNGAYEYADGYRTTATFGTSATSDACSSVTYKDQSACAILTADIDFHYAQLTSPNALIGNSSANAYKGTFNGNNKTVSVYINSTGETEYPALFRYANGATFKNLCVSGKIITNKKYAAGVCGRTEGSAVTFTNVHSNVEIYSETSGDGTHGGMVAVSGVAGSFTNCLVTAKFLSQGSTATTHWGGFIGWAENTNQTFSNCYLNLNSASTNGTTGSNLVARNMSTISGVSYSNTSASRFATTQGASIDAKKFTSGEVTRLLNGSVNGGTTWRQNLTGTTDTNPTLNQSHNLVYLLQDKYCNGSNYGSAYYSNNSTAKTDHHSYNSTTGVCQYSTIGVHGNPASGSGTADDPYQISNQGHLVWFSDVTNGWHGETRNLAAHAKLTTDLDMSGISFTSIGLYSDTKSSSTYFKGVFDGQGHVISNLNVTAPETYEAGFVSRLQGTVQNLILYKETVKAKPYVSARIGGIAGLTHTNAVISCCGVIDATLTNENDKTVQLGGIIGGYSQGALGFNFTDYSKFFGTGSQVSSHTNCFENVPSAWITSGELCWRLNGCAVTGQVWHQNLDKGTKDNYPIPTATNHNTVYLKYADAKVSFSNTSSDLTADQTVSISTAAQLNDVARAIVWGYTGKINVKQTADIDYSAYTGITDQLGAYTVKPYKGVYDGQYHKVTIAFNTDEDYSGLFRVLNGATIKNLHTTGTLTSSSRYNGGVAGGNTGAACKFENVTSDVKIICSYAGDITTGGLIGLANVGVTFNNCAFYGKFTGTSSYCWGGLCGWEVGGATITGCYVSLDAASSYGNNGNDANNCTFTRNTKSLTITNCCYLSAIGTAQGTPMTATQFGSGEACFFLNGYDGSKAWHQNLTGTKDSYPVLNSSHNDVYLNYTDKKPVFTSTAAAATVTVSLGTAAELNNLAKLYNLGYQNQVNVTLTDDIDYTSYKNMTDMIGFDETKPYRGTFDGGGHTVKVNFNNNTDFYAALFRVINGATIKNLHTSGNITSGYLFCGGVAAWSYQNKPTLQNVTSDVTITSTRTTDVGNGGLVGYSQVGTNYKNCGFYGKFVGADATTPYWGGLSGRADAADLLTNCYVAFTASNIQSSQYNYTFSAKIDANSSNYYYINTLSNPNVTTQPGTDASQFATGELCYKLNNNVTDGTQAWYQTLTGESVDAYPVPNNSHSTVYNTTNYYCDGKTVKSTDYQNVATTTDKHEYEAENNTTNGFCHGTPNQEHLQPAGETTISGTKYYTIGNAGQLYWFADKVNNDNSNYGSAKAKLTDNIVVNKGTFAADGTWSETGTPRAWTPIGKGCVDIEWYEFKGTFDGDGHTVNGLYFNNSATDYVGLIGSADNATIKRVGVVGGYIYGHEYVGGVCGLSSTSTINDCYTTCTISGSHFVGGISGRNVESSTISNCYATGTVTGSSSIGGVCGSNGATISNCYATGTVTGSSSIGGVCGYNDSNVSNCYATGTVTGDDEDDKSFGGICGKCEKHYGNPISITNCYSLIDPIGESYNTTLTNVEKKDEDTFHSGEITWKLNSGKTDGTQAWYQTANTGYPSLAKAADGSNTIYGMNRNYNNTGKLPVTLTTFDGKKYGAIYADFPWTIDATDVKAYIAESNTDGVLKMTEVTSVPTGTSVVLVGSTDGTASLTYNATATGSQGILSGSDQAVAASGKYLFGRKDGIVGFYTTTAEQVAAFKPYLETSSSAKGYVMVFEDGETTNLSPALSEGEGAMNVYNLQGQKLAAPRKGINIINGKKVMVK